MTDMNTNRNIVLLPLACVLVGLSSGLTGCSDPWKLESRDTAASPDENVRAALDLARQAEQAEAKGKTGDAIDLYKRSLRLNPNVAAVWNNLGVIFIEQEDYMDAVSALQYAADLDQSDPRPVENLGNAYHLSGHDQDAMRYYLESLQRDPNWLPSLRGLARTATRLNATDSSLLGHMNRALMLEKDPRWRELFERERIRLEYEYKLESQA